MTSHLDEDLALLTAFQFAFEHLSVEIRLASYSVNAGAVWKR